MGASLLFLIRLWYGNCLADRAVIFSKKLVCSLGLDFMSQVTGQYCRIYTFDLDYFLIEEARREVFSK